MSKSRSHRRSYSGERRSSSSTRNARAGPLPLNQRIVDLITILERHSLKYQRMARGRCAGAATQRETEDSSNTVVFVRLPSRSARGNSREFRANPSPEGASAVSAVLHSQNSDAAASQASGGCSAAENNKQISLSSPYNDAMRALLSLRSELGDPSGLMCFMLGVKCTSGSEVLRAAALPPPNRIRGRLVATAVTMQEQE
ncbi:hypothetical protein L207DRAFT_521850 [Hyaloscypha variabilis F]|uniref:Uncharacterized protein n=1 Tax=Hyaloscypha variabilis (strain UAMH 11265 / GT02V1 / F) TaxID=1149755 RepID=A0A2J6SCL8_HYAVF|nr:hypothetical protein L207DRAFT_521850 [Hyaloscypha variabilis F]